MLHTVLYTTQYSSSLIPREEVPTYRWQKYKRCLATKVSDVYHFGPKWH